IDVFIKKKSEFLKKELSLTDAEAEVFIPLEAELSKKIYEANHDLRKEWRELIFKPAYKTKAEKERITYLTLERERREAVLRAEYFKKFATVLSTERINKYRKADDKYRKEMLMDYNY
ncbi:MAG: hypothetical protein LBL79_03630, partial [Prevotella sp.]|nr:hypothetical protein [Prevotella sp.]